MGDVAVNVAGASVDYGAVRAVDSVSLQVPVGGIHVLLGHSGSGKTTLLRAIAGFEALVSGRIEIAGRLVDDGTRTGWVAPEQRRIGFVFQDYALFSHLDAAGNVAFGVSGDRAARQTSARGWLERVHLQAHAARRPAELSGGEQQRVALARALAQGPALVLLDEPFSNLDPQMRRSVRADTVALLRQSGSSAVFVTHDVEEAFAIGDSLSVLERGRLVQTGAAEEIYARPANRAVARLGGAANFVRIEEVVAVGRVRCALGEAEAVGEAAPGRHLVIRPEDLEVTEGDAARIVGRRYLGPVEELELALGEATVVVRCRPRAVPQAATTVGVRCVAPCAVVD